MNADIPMNIFRSDVFFNVFWRSSLRNGMLDYGELYKLCAVSRCPFSVPNSQFILCDWLRRHEAGRGAWSENIVFIYREYRAACLMRAFFRQLLSLPDISVIAGGFLATRYLESQCISAWTPGDVDVFVAIIFFFYFWS